MGKIRKMEREQAEQRKKAERKRTVVLSSVLVCIIAMLLIWLVISQQTVASSASIAPDSNGDLRIPKNSLRNHLNYIDYGGAEEIILWKAGGGEIRTAFDTCEQCYSMGDVHFTLKGDTLTCSLCHTTQSVSVLGTESWGGCRPVSIVSDARADTGGEVVIPAAALAYAKQVFTRWDASDFSISMATYSAAE